MRTDPVLDHVTFPRKLEIGVVVVQTVQSNTGQLPDLLAIAAGAGVHHERDGIELLLTLVVVERLQHDVRDLVGAMSPDVDDLVVTLTRRDHAFAVLLFDLGDLLLCIFDLLALLLRNDHVIDTDGAAGPGRFLAP